MDLRTSGKEAWKNYKGNIQEKRFEQEVSGVTNVNKEKRHKLLNNIG